MPESLTHPDAPRAGGETPSEATLAEIRKGVEDAREGRVVDRGSFAAHASETPETRVDNLLRDFQNACEMVVVLGDSNLSETTKLRAVLRNQLRASLLARHRDGERAEWHRRMSDEHCGTDEIVGYGPYHAEMLSDEALFLELGEEIFTVYFDKKKPCLNDGRAHRKGVLQMRYEETRARSAPPSPERASK